MYEWQHDFYHDYDHNMYFLVAANQTGKMEALDKLLPTPDGYRCIGDLAVGDNVFGEDGNIVEVIGIPYEGARPFFKITFDDGSVSECGQEHLWKVKTEKNRFRPEYTVNRGANRGKKIPNPSYAKWQVLETQEIIKLCGYADGKTPRNGLKAVIPVCEPVKYPEKDLPIDPYVMGAMIGDGTCCSNIFGCGDPEITERLASYSGSNITWDARKKTYSICRVDMGDYNEKSLSKYIPEEYLLASVHQRLELLKGLMDTDGSIYGKNTIEYCTISERLKDNFIELINSLGGVVGRIRRKKAWYYNDKRERVYCNDVFSIVFKIEINPFWLRRKADKFRSSIRYKHQRIIEKIEAIGAKEGRCIAVTGGLYLTGREYIVTHNSSIQIRKRIDIATRPDMWPKLWPRAFKVNPNTKPMSWYLYPNQTTTLDEYYEKWVKTLLPKEEYKDHPIYGWKSEIRNKILKSITFNTGYTIYFKTYNQNVSDLQAGTAYAIDCDEELVYGLFPELSARLFATDGQFSMAFTATLGQEEWRQAMDFGDRGETFKDAWKRTISMYDCTKYADGTETEWTLERIKQKEAMCSSRTEVRRRIYGEFVKVEGLKYSGFDRVRNLVKYPRGHTGQEFRGVPKGWMVYSGVDIGSGGKTGHPSAYVFISVNPDFNKLRVFKCRRLDKIDTTAGDTLKHYINDRGDIKPVMQCYDWASKDFGTIAERSGEYFVKAEKSHAIGEQVLNAAFKSGMLKIYDDGIEARKLAYELEILGVDDEKRRSKDDLIDALRYAITRIPIDWKDILNLDTGEKSVKLKKDKYIEMLEEQRPSGNWNEQNFEEEDFSEECDEWNEMY